MSELTFIRFYELTHWWNRFCETDFCTSALASKMGQIQGSNHIMLISDCLSSNLMVCILFFYLTYLREVAQKYRNIFVHFLVQMKTLKSASEINWPLASHYILTPTNLTTLGEQQVCYQFVKKLQSTENAFTKRITTYTIKVIIRNFTSAYWEEAL